mmetsp:Transcript_40982/g.96381  ORF Transcript_40982/g.96381 Transcript_40982/m.96381 type:complete len:230 (+) Transcript_40982:1857-2546(+)
MAFLALALTQQDTGTERGPAVPGLRDDPDVAGFDWLVKQSPHVRVAVRVAVENAAALDVGPRVTLLADLDPECREPLVVRGPALEDNSSHVLDGPDVNLEPLFLGRLGRHVTAVRVQPRPRVLALAHVDVAPCGGGVEPFVGRRVGHHAERACLPCRRQRTACLLDHFLLAQRVVPDLDALDRASRRLLFESFEERHVLRLEFKAVHHLRRPCRTLVSVDVQCYIPTLA